MPTCTTARSVGSPESLRKHELDIICIAGDLVHRADTHTAGRYVFREGIFAPGQGLLPKYTSGVHGNMIISRRLANTGGMIPRLFDPREAVYTVPQK